MPWARKSFGTMGSWGADQDKIDKMVLADGRLSEYLMASFRDTQQDDWPTIVYILVPDNRLAAFEGYEPITEADLPERARLLYGLNIEFEKYFKYPLPGEPV